MGFDVKFTCEANCGVNFAKNINREDGDAKFSACTSDLFRYIVTDSTTL